ncbi:MAG TPA: EipA family protein [Novosphingobium sp.]|nr:EipA family protein [Novosphingobium sp.]
MSKHSNLHGAASGRAGRLTGLLARRGLAHRGLARAALVAGALGLAVGPALATAAAAQQSYGQQSYGQQAYGAQSGGVDSDLMPTPQASATASPRPAYTGAPSGTAAAPYAGGSGAYQGDPTAAPRYNGYNGAGEPNNRNGTYHEDDLIGAATGVFGKGAHGLADVIKDILKKQGEPNGYIVGREAGGALAVGLRYGSGTLFHKVEGQMPVYWTGPSLGFDVGASAAKTFVLVYNLYNTDDLFHRYGAGEGQAYFIGGFHVSYLRRGDVVLIPVRLGVGLRLGINGGYMKMSRHQNWLPF